MSTANFLRYIILIQYGPLSTTETSMGNNELGTIPGPPLAAAAAAAAAAEEGGEEEDGGEAKADPDEAEAEAEVEAETEAEGYYLSALLILLAGPNAHWHSSSSLLGCPLQFYY